MFFKSNFVIGSVVEEFLGWKYIVLVVGYKNPEIEIKGIIYLTFNGPLLTIGFSLTD